MSSTLELIRIIRTRQLILRRIIDSILCTLVRNQFWVLKRFIVQQEMQRIDPTTLSHTLEVAVARNQEERMRFDLIGDMTSYAHLGDLVEIDFSTDSQSRWRIIELKEGRVNDLLSGILDEKQGRLSEDDLKEISANLGDKASKQAQRMVRQRQRVKQAMEIIETDQGIDPQINERITLLPDAVELDNYAEAVNNVCDAARKNGVGIAIVDGCLRLLGVKDEHIRASDIGLVDHSFFHMARPGQPCLLGDQARREEELRGMNKIPPFIDLIARNLRANWCTPLYIWLKPEHAIEALMGRLRVFAQFDFEKFFEIAASHGIKLSWVTRDTDGGLSKLAPIIPGSPRAMAVRAQLGDGTDHTLLFGFFARVMGDVISPMELIKLIHQFPEQVKKMKERGVS